MALQNEAYSAIPGIKSTLSSLDHSLAAGITRIERTRLTLLGGALPSTDRLKHIQTVIVRAQTGPMTDLRDWELMPGFTAAEKASVSSLRELSTLGAEIKEGWVAAWGSVILALARYLSGQPPSEPQYADDNVSQVKKPLNPCTNRQ